VVIPVITFKCVQTMCSVSTHLQSADSTVVGVSEIWNLNLIIVSITESVCKYYTANY
jgi:hypothetical protein